MLVLLCNDWLYSGTLWECSTGCQKPTMRKAVLIRKRDLLWLCSVTGEFTREGKDAGMFALSTFITHALAHSVD